MYWWVLDVCWWTNKSFWFLNEYILISIPSLSEEVPAPCFERERDHKDFVINDEKRMYSKCYPKKYSGKLIVYTTIHLQLWKPPFLLLSLPTCSLPHSLPLINDRKRHLAPWLVISLCSAHERIVMTLLIYLCTPLVPFYSWQPCKNDFIWFLSQWSWSLPIGVTKACQTGVRYFSLSILIFCSSASVCPFSWSMFRV